METRRSQWSSILQFLLFSVFCTSLSFAFIQQGDQQKSDTATHNTTYLTISIDKLLISSPPEPCCAFRKTPSCRVCAFRCKFRVYDAQHPPRVFIDHQFNCSIETTGQKIRIPLLRQLTTSKIDVELGIFTEKNEQLVSGLASLFVENLEHEPESRILKINIEERYDINFNVSLSCVEGFVGPYCNISCKPPKIGEHHLCSPAGKFCESGYKGDDCAEPICTYGCVRGKCVGPNVCSCNPGWYGNRCELCKPTDECKNPFYDTKAKRCKCSNSNGRISDTSLSDDLRRLDHKYNMESNNSTYLTLSVLIIVLLCICALLLVVVIILTIRNSTNLSLSCFGSSGLLKKTQATNTVQPASHLANV